MHVFDHTIKPILLYDCEMWGTFNTFSAKFRHGMQNLSFDQIYCKQKAQLLHHNFCKYILGVHKKSTNVAVLSELGRFLLHFNVIKAMIRYYDRLKKKLKKCFLFCMQHIKNLYKLMIQIMLLGFLQ
jgi:hypothetical protein